MQRSYKLHVYGKYTYFGLTNPKTSINHKLFIRVILRIYDVEGQLANILGWLILRVLSIRVFAALNTF